MAGMKTLLSLSFTCSVGLTFIVLACVLYKVGWPALVLPFFLFAPLPTLIANRYTQNTGSSNSGMDLAIFVTMAFVVSSLALPVVLARSPVKEPTIEWGAAFLTLAADVVVYITYLGFFMLVYQEDHNYAIW
ncbi:Vacuolar protein sorting 55 [Nesidiocoris tenuis]|uniref:Vacuolar protein sorting 55 n=1 Tax=Nesidiocoris tenuis TaxID=355587 RepID=A0ABN7A624_9HEMI|nr:Vacuolar protein sorting 55 [Nesidiocoris tenuis]